MIKFIIVFSTFLLSFNSFSTGFNKYNTSENSMNHDRPYGYTIDRDIVRKGNVSQRFEIRHGDCGYDKDFNDCLHDRRRYERYVKPISTEKPDGVVWYAWSLYLPEDFQELHPANTTLGQVKIHGYREPLFHLIGRKKGIKIKFDPSDQQCKLIRFGDAIGQWTDFLIKVDYSTNEETDKLYSEIYINGESKDCEINHPVLTKQVLRDRRNKKQLKINFRYGIYNSYVSRWLDKHKTKDVFVETFSDKHGESGMVVISATNKPWDVDWGIDLPTQVVYYDEVRVGPTRESVDINMNEAVD